MTGAPGQMEFLVLGPLDVRLDGAALDVGPRKQRAVLALLLLNANRVVSTDRLIDELWGETPPDTARSALQVYVARLRKILGADGAVIRTTAPGYVLEVENGALDVDRFVSLRAQAGAAADAGARADLLHAALDLWRDAPLADLDTEPFAAAASRHLEELRLGALEERIEADLDLGRHATLVPELEALVAEHPYRERFRAQLMLALYRSGRQADALAAFAAARRELAGGLGLEPGPELRALQRAVLEQDPALAPPPHEAPRPAERRRRRVAAAVALALLLIGIALLVATAGEEPAAITAQPNSLAVIDAATNRVVTAVPVGVRPGPLAVGAGAVWAGNVDDRTLAHVNPATRQLVKTIPLPATPTGLAYADRAVWVAHGQLGRVSRVDPQFDRVADTVSVAGRALYFPYGSVAGGEGAIWAAFGNSTLTALQAGGRRRSTLAGAGPAAVIVAYGSVWVANSGESTVRRFDPRTFEQGFIDEISVGRTPTALAQGASAVWVANAGDDSVTRIDPDTGAAPPIEVGDEPSAVAFGGGAVWVANRGDGTVSRIDPATNDVVETIEVGGAPSGIAVHRGGVWVAVQAP